MSLQFTKATLNDANAIATLAREIWYEHYPSIISNEQIEYMLQLMYAPDKLTEQMQRGCEFTLAHNNNEFIGYIATEVQQHTNLFIHKFYIHAKARGTGIGEQLLNYIIVNNPTITEIDLVVNRQNYKSINFYFKQGFTIIDAFDNDIGNGYYMNDFKMRLKTKHHE